MKPWVLDMWWHDVGFMHWRADAGALAKRLPAGLELDRFDGDAWLSVVPFRMANIRPRGGPVLPGFASVPEINLRTYVRAGDRTGVWFFSLDAASPIAVLAARIMTALPYFDARITMGEEKSVLKYTSERTSSHGVGGHFSGTYGPIGDVYAPSQGSLDAFLHERYRFFTVRHDRLLTAEIRHDAWPLQRATCTITTNTLGALVGDELARPPELVTFARRLHVRATATARLR